jgi:hypothetical protein
VAACRHRFGFNQNCGIIQCIRERGTSYGTDLQININHQYLSASTFVAVDTYFRFDPQTSHEQRRRCGDDGTFWIDVRSDHFNPRRRRAASAVLRDR